MPPSVQQRVEQSGPGRAVISVLIAVLLLCVLVTQLPAGSYARKTLSSRTQPMLNMIGLDQNWGVFAPDPRRESLELFARINYPDGGTETWRPPDRNPVIGTYSDYRWRKLIENVIGDDGKGALSQQLAIWVAREQRGRSDAPSTVTLVKRSAANQPPGSRLAKEPFAESQFYELSVRPEMLKGGG